MTSTMTLLLPPRMFSGHPLADAAGQPGADRPAMQEMHGLPTEPGTAATEKSAGYSSRADLIVKTLIAEFLRPRNFDLF